MLKILHHLVETFIKKGGREMLNKILFFCFLLSITSCNKDNPVSPDGNNQQPAESTEDKWVAKADMPTARGYFCGLEVNGKMYLFGGLLSISSNNSDAVEVYDPETDKWTIKNKMPEKIFGQAAVELNGKIYIFGGRTGNLFSGTSLNHTYLYDPDADSWTTKADMLVAGAFLTASVIDAKIYIIGGSGTGFQGMTTVQMYDPAADTWTIKAGLDKGRALPTANVFNGKIYVIGGGTSSTNSAGTAFADFDVYDPLSDSWNSKQNIAQARIGHGSVVINNKLYICGGFTSDSIELKDLSEYDFNNDKWTTRTSMPSPRRCFISCVYNGKFFIFGGVSGPQGSQLILKSVMAYTPPSASN